MSHAHTVIEPAAGLTVLVGPNNCGKSALVAALQILCHNDNSTYVLRHQAKDCQIIVETQEGHVIEWSRKKSGSPKYTINGKPFDRLKRNVPPELHAALRLPKVTSDKQEFDVHFGEQKRPVFLLNDSGGAAAEFFASSSDAIRLVEMQALHKQKVRDAKRDQTSLLLEKQAAQDKLNILAPVKNLDDSIVAAEKRFVALAVKAEDISAIDKLITNIVDCHKNLLYRESLVGCFGPLQLPPDFQDTRELERLLQHMTASSSQTKHAATLSDALQTISPPPEIEDESHLEKLIDQIITSSRRAQRDDSKQNLLRQVAPAPELEPTDPLAQLICDVRDRRNIVTRLNKQLDDVTCELALVQTEILAWASANPICPTCKGPVAAENLLPENHEKVGSQ